jgi:membrane peptidoglycan carboxypeptidase
MRMGKRLYSLLMFVVVSVIGGLLAAGLVVPMASLVASGGVAAADSLKSLPAELETPPQAERSRLLNADGSVLTYFYDENRIYRTLDKIAPIMRQAQVDIEDTRFYDHGAIDLYGTLRALARTSQGNTQGGSTITQQYVRLVQVEAANAKDDAVARTAATENSVARKVREMRYSVAVEQRMTKDEILEAYLNISYYGAGAYGVEAAARRYFGHSASELTLPESAMLAGMVRNPNLTNPLKHPEEALERRNNVLDRMAEIGTITAAEAAEAKATEIDTSKGREVKLGCQNANFPFICDYALRTLLQAPSLGSTVAEREERIMSGGLTIRTMIDPTAQRKAEKTISSFISGKDPVVAVIVMLEPGTGQIIAMAQNRQKMGTNQKKGETSTTRHRTGWGARAGSRRAPPSRRSWRRRLLSRASAPTRSTTPSTT